MFIADMTGNCHSFFEYSANYETFEFGTQVKKCIVHKTQKFADASENARLKLVRNMNRGSQLVWHVETMVPEFGKYDCKDLPLKDMVFKRDKLMENYMTLVHHEENKDLQGNYGYEMHEDFNQCILMNIADPITDDEMVQMLLDEIPNIEEFKTVYIMPEN